MQRPWGGRMDSVSEKSKGKWEDNEACRLNERGGWSEGDEDGGVGGVRAYRALEIMLSIFGIYPKHNKIL